VWLSRTAPGADSRRARDIERCRRFSDGYLALEPGNPYRIANIRYSLPPNEIGGLWGIGLSRRAGGDHVSYEVSRQVNPGALARFRAMPFD